MAEAIKEKGALSVHTEKLFPIIKKWLYSDREIFLRELISNAYDAIYKLERLGDMGEYKEVVPGGRVNIAVDATKRTLTISDNGLGMTGAEVKKYINQIAFSGAEEFLAKYEKDGTKQTIIGHFGLGFFSAFMVADEIEIITRSHQFPKEKTGAVHWKCTGTTDFTLASTERNDVGTDIILHLSKDNEDLLDEARIKELVIKFSDFLPIEIAVNDKKVNRQNPIWQKKATALTETDYKDFYKHLFPHSEEALFYVHIGIDYPFQVKGILYFPKIRADIDVTKTGRIKLFCNNVFVSDNVVEVIPQYLNMLQGVIDSPDIPLNVSRSALQSDVRVKKLGSHIVKKLADKLVSLAKNDRGTYEKYWKDIHPFVKFGVINDVDFYEKVKPALIFTSLSMKGSGGGAPTKNTEAATQKAGGDENAMKSPASKKSDSNVPKKSASNDKADISDEVGEGFVDKDPRRTSHQMVTLEEYKANNPKLKDKILYATNEENEHRYIADVQKAGGEVLVLNSPIDPHFIQYLETKVSLRFLRVDSAPVDELMASDHEADLAKDKSLDEEGDKAYIEFFKKTLNIPSQDISFKTLADKETMALFIVNEHMRRFQEMSSLMNTETLKNDNQLLGMTLVLNRAHPIISKTRSWVRSHSKSSPSVILDKTGATIATAEGNEQKSSQQKSSPKTTEKATEKVNSDKTVIKADPNIENTLRNIYDLALLRAGKLKGEALELFVNRAGAALEQTIKL
ncbi:chaperone protein HtpG [Spirochaetota bacterium]|nr:chaperone protein HtpG [Spirochaetota bacterium]